VYVAAAELGAIGLAGTLCNTWGLQQIPALTGAVLLTFTNVFTPLEAALLGATESERNIDRTTWGACAVAFVASVYALLPDTDGGGAPVFSSIGQAELSVLGAAFFFAAAKVRLGSHLTVHPADTLTAGRLVSQAGLAAFGLGLLDETNLVHELLPTQQGGMGLNLMEASQQAGAWLSGLSLEQTFWIVASAMLSGAAALWCQGRGQKGVVAPRAQIYFATSPLFGALWALVLLHEPITRHEILGGGVLIAGLTAASLSPDVAELEREQRREQER
jgi:drug/metabolite transporter (DMT)-like permease